MPERAPIDPLLTVDVADPAPPTEPDWSGPAGVAEDPTLAAEVPPRGRSVWRSVREWVIVIGVALGVALVIRTYVVAPFYIPSDSMFDTLHVDDRILVNKLSYRLHDVNRGDVVVFRKPEGVNFGDDAVEDLIKRVIGLPGDTLEFRDCSVFVNARRLDEPYTDGSCTEPPNAKVDPEGDGLVVVPDGTYFVMGDNRRPGQSFDSRFWGTVEERLIVGRAFVIIWPNGRWGWL
jgi:signal peptidase I